jgi:threonine dehydratase
VGLAALVSGKVDAEGKNVVIVLSGGNADPDIFAQAIVG